MKKAVMYGAGNIGRGFIGKVLSESGYEVCFVDIQKAIVDSINQKKEYPVRIVSNECKTEETVQNIRAVDGMFTEEVAEEIAKADIMATAVGVNVLPKIVRPICAGLKKRFDSGGDALNIIICENLIDSHLYLRRLIDEEMGVKYKDILDEKLGLVEASIGRMVPVMTDEMCEGNPLRVWVESYCELPADKDAFKGTIPQDIKGLLPYSPFSYYIKRKLFIHNMAHAMCSYLGWQKGYTYLFECVEDAEILTLTKAAMEESAQALNKQYSISMLVLEEHIYDLLYRFRNRALGDTVARVGTDPIRKLLKTDRLVGAAMYCIEQDIKPVNILKGIAAGLGYNNPNDKSAVAIQEEIVKNGIAQAVKNLCGINEHDAVYTDILNEYLSLKNMA
jgi:mannitol-1-phosphate 5-dehydrogenase